MHNLYLELSCLELRKKSHERVGTLTLCRIEKGYLIRKFSLLNLVFIFNHSFPAKKKDKKSKKQQKQIVDDKDEDDIDPLANLGGGDSSDEDVTQRKSFMMSTSILQWEKTVKFSAPSS